MKRYLFLTLVLVKSVMSSETDEVKRFLNDYDLCTKCPEVIGKFNENKYFVVDKDLAGNKIVVLIKKNQNDLYVEQCVKASVTNRKRNGTQTLNTDIGSFYLPARMFTASPTFTDLYGHTYDVIICESRVTNFPWCLGE